MPQQFKTHPVIIDPYDEIVQSAVREMGSALRDVDVIKLENTCPGNKAAWVSNKDFFEGIPGKQRVIHLCLKKIQNQFKKEHGQPFTITDPSEKKQMKEVVKTYLKDVILPHETEHIHQEMKGEGKFGPSPESAAERAEKWKNLEQYGYKKRACLSLKLKEAAYHLNAGIGAQGVATIRKIFNKQIANGIFNKAILKIKLIMNKFPIGKQILSEIRGLSPRDALRKMFMQIGGLPNRSDFNKAKMLLSKIKGRDVENLDIGETAEPIQKTAFAETAKKALYVVAMLFMVEELLNVAGIGVRAEDIDYLDFQKIIKGITSKEELQDQLNPGSDQESVVP